MTDLSRIIAGLTPQQQELLLRRLGKLQPERPSAAPEQILPQPRTTSQFPLSFAQQRLWFLDQLEPNSASYNVAMALRFQGQLNRAALEHAYQEIIRRHESLRTSFSVPTSGDDPVQIIHPYSPQTIPLIDLAHLPETEREAEVHRLAIADAQRPFDLTIAPLIRTTLVRLSDHEHVLLVNIHHIVSDGWSVGVIIRELAAFYTAFIENTAAALPDLSIQCADYAVWQRNWLSGALREQQVGYWKQALSGSPPLLELPTDRPRPATQTYRGSSSWRDIGSELFGQIQALSDRAGTTLFMTLLAGFYTLLYRYTQQTDLLIGTPVAGRSRKEVEGLIGFFVNTLVLRANLEGNPTFLDLLGRVRKVALGAYAHQDLPFELLVEELRVDRNLSHAPIFQVLFILQNMPLPPLELPDLTLSMLEAGNSTAKFDLSLSLYPMHDGLRCIFEYNTDLFDAATIERMQDHFQLLLTSFTADPTQPIAAVDYLSPPERELLLTTWNATTTRYGEASASLHELVAAQAARSPEALALVFEDTTVSYRELDRRANQLAHFLQAHGVGPESRVGICMERSIELVVSLLGVLKAGGVYVPLDPGYPPERLQFMLDDAQVQVVLSQQALHAEGDHGLLHSLFATPVLCVDQLWEIIDQEPITPASATGPEHGAYMIYTSGSTGQPKGALNTHGGIVNRLLWMQDAYNLTPADRVLQKTPFSFDVSVWEFFWPLLTGARLVLARPEGHKDSAYLVRLIAEQGITTLHFVPSMLQVFLEEPGLERCTSLRRVICSGEALPFELQQRFFTRSQAELHNLYGPTEAAVDVTFWACQPDSPLHTVPIGRPVANTELYVLDRQLRPVPIGVPGELYLGGVQLARGYHRRPELTAERFIPHPFNQNRPGARLYRTGDLVRYLADGAVEYLGRLDHQVKLRGFRIELGEIEAALLRHPEIREAVVVAEQSADDTRLIAYVVGENQEPRTKNLEPGSDESSRFLVAQGAPGSDSLRRFLQDKLPEYMLPAVFVPLDALPLTPNGKLDRKALPAPEPTRRETRAYVAPRTPEEEQLANWWCAALGLEQIGVHDNFFSLGGHSLMATRLMGRIRETFKVELPLRSLFETPTIAGVAQQILVFQQQPSPSDAPIPIPRAARSGPIPLSFAQQRLWFLDQLEPNTATYNLPIALRVNGQLDVAALQQTLSTIVARHEALRTTFSVPGRADDATPDQANEPVQIIHAPAPHPLHQVDLSALVASEADETIQQIVQAEVLRPFDLQAGPLLRTSLLRLAPDEHILLLTLHHIVGDGWSLGVLVQEVAALYPAYASGTARKLPELPIQYADVAIWQRATLQGERLEREIGYWQQQLAGVEPLLLPTDRPRPAMQTYRGAVQSFRMPALLDQLRALGEHERATLFQTLLAAFYSLLHRLSGQTDLAVGSPIANRTRPELEPLIGFFVNTLVLRADLAGNPSFRELLQQVRRTTLEAYTHQDLPFEQIVERLQPDRNMSHTPLFQVMFVLQNAPLPPLSMPGLSLRPLPFKSGIAKFDLTFALAESGADLQTDIEYNTDLFDDATIARLGQHWQTLLHAITRQPTYGIDDLPLLTAAEQRQLLVDWNASAAEYPADATVQDLVAAQAARTPDAIALRFGERTVSYRELNRRSNALSRQLQALGVGPDVLVELCVERSIELIVGFLGILKAGGAYVPLDPSYPQERLRFMRQDTQASVLVAQPDLLTRLPETDARIVLLDTSAPCDADDDNPPHRATPDNLAYVIYTSGSTGRPKGVAVTHRGILRLLCNTNYITISPQDRFGQVSNASFDAITFEVWGALIHGAQIVGVPQDVLLTPPAFAAHIRQEQISVMFLTAALFNQMARSEPSAFAGMRQLIAGGEALDPRWVGEVLRHGPPQRLVNGYGPTETTTFAVCHRFDPASSNPLSTPIGRPIANTTLYVLDKQLRPVPIGVPGELYIGGDGLARGYLNRPDLTAERFVPNPFSGNPGARLYRTGDLVRYRADALVEFIGRIDQQVKVRGFRIELGEIEAALAEHPAVGDAVVLAREDRPGEKRLVAYIVEKNQEPRTKNQGHESEAGSRTPGGHPVLGSADLRQHVGARLPEYMIPSAFLWLDRWPLTPNGKLDRTALPAPDAAGTDEAQRTYAAPQTPTEALLAELWTDLLNLPQVGIDENFFELGGHSLLATQLLSLVRDVFRVGVPLRDFFETLTIAGLAQSIDAARQQHGQTPPPTIQPVNRTQPLPLSFGQQRFWFLDQLLPGSTAYNIPLAVRLSGALDRDALQRSLSTIISRHESLRTTFAALSQGGDPVQIIAPPEQAASFRIALIDLCACPADQRQQATEELLAEAAGQPFDLRHGPLLRATLVQLTLDEHVLLLVLHHIITDGWSMTIFVRELTALYQQFSQTGTLAEPILDPLPVQYADFALWQRDWLQGEVLDQQLRYWRGQLGGALPVLNLPLDHPRPAVQSGRGAVETLLLPTALTEALKTLSRREGATLFITLLTAFDVLLYRYTGQRDLLVGTPIAGRLRPEIESVIGLFLNTLVIRTHLDSQATFRALLARVRETTLQAYEHQALPFERLVEELQPERALSHTPVFQVMFNMLNFADAPLDVSGLTITMLQAPPPAKFDLTVTVAESEAGLGIAFGYSPDLFNAATIQRMAAHFQTLLGAVVSDPGQRAAVLPLLAPNDQLRMLHGWELPPVPQPDQLVHRRFEAQAARTPDAIALIVPGARDGEPATHFTYAELNNRANQLAREIAAYRQGGSELLVGLLIERSYAMVLAVLAVLKAGAAYVPLDPRYPTERLHFMLQDTQARLILTQQQLAALAPADLATIQIDTQWPSIARHGEHNLGTEIDADQLAYIIYTSGSTGQPKGVAIPQRGMSNYLDWMQRHYPLNSDDRLLQTVPLSFDVSIREIFWPLLAGAQLVLADPDQQADTAYLIQTTADLSITQIRLVPTLLRAMLEQPGLGRCTSLRRVFTGGEVLPIALQEQFFAVLSAELHNTYGPTEAAVNATAWRCTPDVARSFVPLGQPVANTQNYVLDEYLQPVPFGVAGELCIAGAGLARGYLNRPDITADKFTPNPFSTDPGARLYRTGDLVRHHADGAIEFIGRIDQQVKLRGYRIEPGEIEAALREHADVRDAVVLAREDRPGEKRLVAYVVGEQRTKEQSTQTLSSPVATDAEAGGGSGQGPGVRASDGLSRNLRAFLGQRLPEYMIPASFVVLDALPLTASGKIDRRALPDVRSLALEPAADYVAPRTPVEATLAAIWAELLDVPQVGIHDHFFELGGHSLLALQVIARVRDTLQIEVPVRTLFTAPTVAGLAQSIHVIQWAISSHTAVAPADDSDEEGEL